MARVLIVDDQTELSSVWSEYLGELGHFSVEASSFDAAQAEIVNQAFDIVVLDVDLEPEDERKHMLQMRRSNVIACALWSMGVPVIRVTGTIHHLHPDFTPEGRYAPVALLKKPFSLAALSAAVDQALSSKVAASTL